METRIDIAGPRRRRTFMVSLWLLLATILGHALVPVGSPLARTTGSAFSVSTADVSLGAARHEARTEASEALEPPTPGTGPAQVVAPESLPLWTAAPDRLSLSATSQSFDARGPPAVS